MKLFVVKVRGEKEKGIVHIAEHATSPIFTMCKPNTELPAFMMKLTFDAPLMKIHDACIEAINAKAISTLFEDAIGNDEET